MSETLEEFYNHFLGIESPWEVISITRDNQTKIVTELFISRIKSRCLVKNVVELVSFMITGRGHGVTWTHVIIKHMFKPQFHVLMF